jgi:hypothetical protein
MLLFFITHAVKSYEWGKTRIVITTNYIHDYLWARDPVLVTRVMMDGYKTLSDYFNLTTRNHWFNSFFVNSTWF